MHCQDVSSFANAPVKLCHLWAGSLVCVCACVSVLSLYFCPNCIVKMCRLSAMHLSRCVVFGQGGVCVCVFFLFISAINALSRCVVFRQCTCQDLSSLGSGPCVCVRACVCVFFLFISALNALSRCVVFRLCTCQDVSFWAGGRVCVCMRVCSFSLFLP